MAAIETLVNVIKGENSILPTTTLGKDGPTVSRMGIGLMGLSMAYGSPKSDKERNAFLDALYEKGEVFWDSADVYGDNEDLLGKFTFFRLFHFLYIYVLFDLYEYIETDGL